MYLAIKKEKKYCQTKEAEHTYWIEEVAQLEQKKRKSGIACSKYIEKKAGKRSGV